MMEATETQAAILRDSKQWAALVFANTGNANGDIARALISDDPKVAHAYLKTALEGIRKSEDMLLRAILNVERIA